MTELLVQLDRGAVFTMNLDHLYQLQRDQEFYEAYMAADVVTADSKYVFWALRWVGRPIRERVCGSDLVPAFCDHHRNDPLTKIFLLGAGPGVAELARRRINARIGEELVIGAHSPSMGFVDNRDEIADVVAMINASKASVLIVGLGSPKQEKWIHRHRASLPGVRIFMGVGATIEYEAGVNSRAPHWMRRTGLEWFHRVLTHPRRYLSRYVRDLEFFWLLLLDICGRYRPPFGAAPQTHTLD